MRSSRCPPFACLPFFCSSLCPYASLLRCVLRKGLLGKRSARTWNRCSKKKTESIHVSEVSVVALRCERFETEILLFSLTCWLNPFGISEHVRFFLEFNWWVRLFSLFSGSFSCSIFSTTPSHPRGIKHSDLHNSFLISSRWTC